MGPYVAEAELSRNSGRSPNRWFARHGEPLRSAIVEAAPGVCRYLFGLCGDWHLAEDLMQEALLAAWTQRRRFDGRSQPQTWVYAIARNLWRARLRRQHSRPKEQPMPDEPMESTSASSPPAEAARCELVAAVEAAMAKLPPEQREVLALRESRGLTFGQVAELLQVPVATAKSRARYALEKLAAELRPFDEEAQR